jgi:hypothetical protein
MFPSKWPIANPEATYERVPVDESELEGKADVRGTILMKGVSVRTKVLTALLITSNALLFFLVVALWAMHGKGGNQPDDLVYCKSTRKTLVIDSR